MHYGLAAVGLVTVLLTVSAHAFENCSGSRNAYPVNSDPPVFVKTVTNGKHYIAGKGNDSFHILHLYGSHYEMGYAHGQLMAESIPDVWPKFTTYLENMAKSYAPWLPDWLIDIIATDGLPFALDLVINATRPYTPKKYIDEMQGIADGAKYSFEKIYQINMFPELIKAACTIVGATKSATVSGNVAHLRGLDFSVGIPVKDWPLVTVLHGDGSEPKVANFGWLGLVGSLTGLSNTSIGIGEKVWDRHKKGISSYDGEPWMFLLRDVLYTKDLPTAISTLQNGHRTCAIHVGVGDENLNAFDGVQMAYGAFETFNWTSIDYPQHPIIKDVMYWDKHVQPTGSYCLSTLLKHYVGNITAENLALHISGYSETGDFHSVSFDYKQKVAYFANARKTYVTDGPLNAYQRQYTWLNVSALFEETL